MTDKRAILHALQNTEFNGRNLHNYVSLSFIFELVDAIYDALSERPQIHRNSIITTILSGEDKAFINSDCPPFIVHLIKDNGEEQQLHFNTWEHLLQTHKALDLIVRAKEELEKPFKQH